MSRLDAVVHIDQISTTQQKFAEDVAQFAESVALFDAGQIAGHPLAHSAAGPIGYLALAVKQSAPAAAGRAAQPPVAEDIVVVLAPVRAAAAQPAAAGKAAHCVAAPWQKVSWKQPTIQALAQWVDRAGGCGSAGFGLPQDPLCPPRSHPARPPRPIASRCG